MREKKGEGGGMIAVLLAHEFQKESYDCQSHAAGLCVHTSHCSAADTFTHTYTLKHILAQNPHGFISMRTCVSYKMSDITE